MWSAEWPERFRDLFGLGLREAVGTIKMERVLEGEMSVAVDFEEGRRSRLGLDARRGGGGGTEFTPPKDKSSSIYLYLSTNFQAYLYIQI